MTINWDIAPGSTHFYEDEFGMRVGRKWFIWDDLYREWRPHELNQHNFLLKAAISRPTEDLSWSGDGLPPVGSMVMIDRMGLTIWPDAEQFIGPDVKVLANYKAGDEDMIVVESPDERSNCCFRACRARPIRTPEQIAAEERESGIEGIRKAVSSSTNCKAHGLDWDVAGAIYDAGYRKEVKS